MTLRSLDSQPDVGHADFLARADILGALGFDVLISRFEPFHELAEYLARSTDAPIGIAVGLPALRQFVDEASHPALPGGVARVGRAAVQAVRDDVRVPHPGPGHRPRSRRR